MVLIKPTSTVGDKDTQLQLNIKVSSVDQVILKIKRWLWRFKFTVLQKLLKSIFVWLNFYVVLFQFLLATLWYMRQVRAKAVFWELFYKLKLLNFGILEYRSILVYEILFILFNLLFIYLAFRIAEKHLFGLFPFFMFGLLMLNLAWLKILIVKQAFL